MKDDPSVRQCKCIQFLDIIWIDIKYSIINRQFQFEKEKFPLSLIKFVLN